MWGTSSVAYGKHLVPVPSSQHHFSPALKGRCYLLALPPYRVAQWCLGTLWHLDFDSCSMKRRQTLWPCLKTYPGSALTGLPQPWAEAHTHKPAVLASP